MDRDGQVRQPSHLGETHHRHALHLLHNRQTIGAAISVAWCEHETRRETRSSQGYS